MMSAPEKVEPHESKHRSHAENATYGSVTIQTTQYIWFYISLNACVPLIKMHKKTTPKASSRWHGICRRNEKGKAQSLARKQHNRESRLT